MHGIQRFSNQRFSNQLGHIYHLINYFTLMVIMLVGINNWLSYLMLQHANAGNNTVVPRLSDQAK